MPDDLSPGAPARFTGRAESYALNRPECPDSLLDAALRGLPPEPIVADVGAGTGLSTARLAVRSAHVHAIEPNPDMRRRLIPGARVTVHPGAAEATGLPAGSVDAACCVQSFHWFRAAEALPELHRILRPGGRLVLIWYLRDGQDPFTRALSGFVMRKSGGSPAADVTGAEAPLRESPLFALEQALEERHPWRLDADGLVGWARSASYLPVREGQLEPAVEAGLRALVARWAGPDGRVAVVLRWVAFTARPLARP
ncbi:MAG: class I SAM-dependent methyltransferase [Anaeromyxobacter sp.]